MVLAWVVGGAALWVVAGAAMAFLVAAVIGRAGRPSAEIGAPEPAGSGSIGSGSIGSGVRVPVQRSASPTGPRSQPHLPCAGVGRSPSHR